MFPIRDHNPSSRTPFVTYALIAINVLVFLGYFPALQNSPELNIFYSKWALVPAAISEGELLHGLFTSMFLHGGWMHLGGNMLFLWIFGDNLEDEMGHVKYLLFYLASGLAAGLAQYATAPYSTVPMVGASGAIAGLMGGYLLLFPKARVDVLFIFIIFFRIFAIPAWIVLGVWFGMQFLNGIGTSADTGGVAYWAHSGGFIAGLILATPLWIRLGGTGFWTRTHGHPPHPETKYNRSNIPIIKRRKTW